MQVAGEAAGQGRDQYEWALGQTGRNQEVLDRVLGSIMPSGEAATAAGQRDRERYEQTFLPLQDQFIEEAQGYDTPMRRSQERGRAVSDVSQQFDAARRNALQRLEGYGVDPSQTRSAALDIGVRTQQAIAQAAAAEAAGRRVEDTGRELRAKAIELGLPLPNQALQGQQLGANINATGSQLANQMSATGAQVRQSALPFQQTALQGYGQGADIKNAQFTGQMGAYGANAARDQQMFGNIAGTVGAVASMIADGGQPRRGGMVSGPSDGGQPRPGGMVSGPSDGTGTDDQVPAYLSTGEYVIPADVVSIKGREFFDKLLKRYHVPAEQQRRAIGVA